MQTLIRPVGEKLVIVLSSLWDIALFVFFNCVTADSYAHSL